MYGCGAGALLLQKWFMYEDRLGRCVCYDDDDNDVENCEGGARGGFSFYKVPDNVPERCRANEVFTPAPTGDRLLQDPHHQCRLPVAFRGGGHARQCHKDIALREVAIVRTNEQCIPEIIKKCTKNREIWMSKQVLNRAEMYTYHHCYCFEEKCKWTDTIKAPLGNKVMLWEFPSLWQYQHCEKYPQNAGVEHNHLPKNGEYPDRVHIKWPEDPFQKLPEAILRTTPAPTVNQEEPLNNEWCHVSDYCECDGGRRLGIGWNHKGTMTTLRQVYEWCAFHPTCKSFVVQHLLEDNSYSVAGGFRWAFGFARPCKKSNDPKKPYKCMDSQKYTSTQASAYNLYPNEDICPPGWKPRAPPPEPTPAPVPAPNPEPATDKEYKCYYWTKEDREAIDKLGSDVEAERAHCAEVGKGRNKSFVFSEGDEKLAPGCGACYCCEPVDLDDDIECGKSYSSASLKVGTIKIVKEDIKGPGKDGYITFALLDSTDVVGTIRWDFYNLARIPTTADVVAGTDPKTGNLSVNIIYSISAVGNASYKISSDLDLNGLVHKLQGEPNGPKGAPGRTESGDYTYKMSTGVSTPEVTKVVKASANPKHQHASDNSAVAEGDMIASGATIKRRGVTSGKDLLDTQFDLPAGETFEVFIVNQNGNLGEGNEAVGFSFPATIQTKNADAAHDKDCDNSPWTAIPGQYCKGNWSDDWGRRTVKSLKECKATCEATCQCKTITVGTFNNVANNCVLCTSDTMGSAAWTTSHTYAGDNDACDDPENPTQKECQAKESKNGCLLRNCGFNEKTGNCNKKCKKYGKAECPAGRCKVEGEDCIDPEDPDEAECQAKESKNGCLLRNCGFNEETGKCNKRCKKYGKAECPAGRCKVEGEDCIDPEDPTQAECEAKTSKNGCVERNCGFNEATGKCNKKCGKNSTAECPSPRCKVENDACVDGEPTDEECQTKTSKSGCVERGCGFNEETGKCNKRCDKFTKAECPAKRCRVNGDTCETEPTDEECQTKTSKNGCVERGCGFNEETGKCNKRCDKFTKAECPAKRCRVNGDTCETESPWTAIPGQYCKGNWSDDWGRRTVKSLKECKATCEATCQCKTITVGTFNNVANNCVLCTSDTMGSAAWTTSHTYAGDNDACDDPENPTQGECEAKTSKNGCVERHCGWSESTGKCNKKCGKFSKDMCPPKRCKVEDDACVDPEDPTEEECESKVSKNGCVERHCGWSESTGKCNKKCGKFSKDMCPPKRCKVEDDACVDPEDPTEEECESKVSKNGCVERHCGWSESTGKCNKNAENSAKICVRRNV
eukprot:TRINITY_DN15_c0_g1_i3.p1 TRINITY_DN15_c0_g1~~TRINITY_DN15_c0_g1_i3.p1  ORF type:complete len:1296 (-),score=273.12 TRINITY_DN15_c0_g1_i3:153-4040(-)